MNNALNIQINNMNFGIPVFINYDDEHYEQELEAWFHVALPFVRKKQLVAFKTDKDEASEQVAFQSQILIVYSSSEFAL